MKIHGCGWRIRHGLGRRSWGCWRKQHARDESMAGVESYMDHVAAAVSFDDFEHKKRDQDPTKVDMSRASAEARPESNSMIDFKSFAHEYPDKLLPLLERLRPEFQELFAEYWLLGKSQSFIGKVHGFIQTRVWQNLRIIEQSIGSLILLGTAPDAEIIRPILRKAKLENTQYGPLTDMILIYAKTQNYAQVAGCFRMPVPAVRKIFRPAIASLLADKDVKAVAVGAYLRSLTHQASLTGAGLSKRCKARNRRVKILRFHAPPSEDSPLMSFGHVYSLGDTPWCVLEISSDHRMEQILPTLRPQGKRLFGKKPAQIFAPLDDNGELTFGYIFARSTTPAAVRSLTKIRGVGEMSTVCDGDGNFVHAVLIPHADVLVMMAKHTPPTKLGIHVGSFVQILTGEAANYCGIVTTEDKNGLIVQVNFPTGRCFLVRADVSSVKRVPNIAGAPRMFWGVLGA